MPFSSVVVTKGRAHRVRRVAAAKPDLPAIFPERAVDGVGIHAAFRSERLAVAAQGTEQRCIGLITVAGAVQIGADALRRSGIDGERLAPAALAGDAQRIKAPVLVQIADIEGGDLGAAETDLQADRKSLRYAADLRLSWCDDPLTRELDGMCRRLIRRSGHECQRGLRGVFRGASE